MQRNPLVLAILVLLAFSTSCASGGAAVAPAPNEPRVMGDAPTVEDMPDEPPVVRGSSSACDVAGAGAAMKAGSVSISVPTLPCEAVRTFEAMDVMDARGGKLAKVTKFFLQVRLVTRGIFSSVMGLFGIG